MNNLKFKIINYEGNKDATIEYNTDELIALCPETGNPDFYKLKISYIPRNIIPELYSFKKYLYSFMTVKIFQEHLIEQIRKDFQDIINPISLHLILSEKTPYGISPTVYL